MRLRPGERGRNGIIRDLRQGDNGRASEVNGRVSDRADQQNEDSEREPFIGNESAQLRQYEIGEEDREQRRAELEDPDEDQRDRKHGVGDAGRIRHAIQGAFPQFLVQLTLR